MASPGPAARWRWSPPPTPRRFPLPPRASGCSRPPLALGVAGVGRMGIRSLLASPPAPAMTVPEASLEVSVVIPCLDERQTIAAAVAAAWSGITLAGADGEVVVVDNGSTDGSAQLATGAGARVVHEPRRGYGSAYL